MQILWWKLMVSFFQCYFQNFHKRLRCDYMYSWYVYHVFSSNNIGMMHLEFFLKKDHASVNCIVFVKEGEKKIQLAFPFFLFNTSFHKAVRTGVNATLHTDTLLHNHMHLHACHTQTTLWNPDFSLLHLSPQFSKQRSSGCQTVDFFTLFHWALQQTQTTK